MLPSPARLRPLGCCAAGGCTWLCCAEGSSDASVRLDRQPSRRLGARSSAARCCCCCGGGPSAAEPPSRRWSTAASCSTTACSAALCRARCCRGRTSVVAGLGGSLARRAAAVGALAAAAAGAGAGGAASGGRSRPRRIAGGPAPALVACRDVSEHAGRRAAPTRERGVGSGAAGQGLLGGPGACWRRGVWRLEAVTVAGVYRVAGLGAARHGTRWQAECVLNSLSAAPLVPNSAITHPCPPLQAAGSPQTAQPSSSHCHPTT